MNLTLRNYTRARYGKIRETIDCGGLALKDTEKDIVSFFRKYLLKKIWQIIVINNKPKLFILSNILFLSN